MNMVTFVIKCNSHNGTPLDTFQGTEISLAEEYFFLYIVYAEERKYIRRKSLYKRVWEIKSHRSVVGCLGNSEDESAKACYHLKHICLPDVSTDT
jgi:hypothetical protein